MVAELESVAHLRSGRACLVYQVRAIINRSGWLPCGRVAFTQTDVRGVLPSIQVPTLLLYRRENAREALDSQYLASHIRAARLVELPGFDHFPWAVYPDATVREVERFLSSVRAEEADLDRVLATVLFTDIVGSTEKVAALGDAGWRDLVERHHATVRALLARYRGREIDTAGDGFFASFDGRRERYAAPRRLLRRCGPWGSRSERVFIPARSRRSATRWAALP